MNNIEVPGQYNLFDFSGVPSFESSQKGRNLQKQYNEAKESSKSDLKTLNYGKWAAIVIGFLCLQPAIWFIGVSLLILAFFMRKNGYFANNIKQKLKDISNAYTNNYYEYMDEIIAALTNKYSMANWRSYRHGTKGIVYNDQGFMYFDVSNNLLLIYSKDNIKEVSRERVHIGSHTTQNSSTLGGGTRIGNTNLVVGSASTNTNADTNDFYEWHFDILTNFIKHPKISFILPDSPQVENFVGKAYAILKP